MKDYSDTELKAMAFDVIRQIGLLENKRQEILRELIKRKAIEEKVEVTPDEPSD